MKIRFMALVAIAAMALLSACASSMSERDISEIKRIGIINQFPEKPTYSVFKLNSSEIGDADLPGAKAYLTNKFIAELESLEFQAQEVSGESALRDGQVDLILKLVPIKKTDIDPNSGVRLEASEDELEDGTNGYGIYYKSLLVIQIKPEAYVAMQVERLGMDDGDVEVLDTFVKRDDYNLNIGELPNSWRRLRDRERNEAEEGLQRAIDQVVEEVVADMGF